MGRPKIRESEVKEEKKEEQYFSGNADLSFYGGHPWKPQIG
jgi:hypothetical protein